MTRKYLTPILILISLNSPWRGSATVITNILAPPSLLVSGKAVLVHERGEHYKVWHTVSLITNQAVSTVTIRAVTNRYTEVATGLHYRGADGTWHDSDPQVSLALDGGAEALKIPHKVWLAPDIRSVGAVRLTLPGGQVMRSTVRGIFLYDRSSERSVLLAETVSRTGELQAPNKVVYPKCFDTINASVVLTVTKHGLEQDVVLHEKPAFQPEDFEMNPATTTIEIWTEIFEAPEPTSQSVIVRAADSTNAPATALIDQILEFPGGMRMPRGHAFIINDPTRRYAPRVPTGKALETLEERRFLIESTRWRDAAPHLNRLATNSVAQANAATTTQRFASLKRTLPALLTADASKSTNRIQMARSKSNAPRQLAFIFDYLITLASQPGYHFKGENTYLVSSTVDLRGGPVVIDPAVVIKYGADAAIIMREPVDCRSSSFRPLVLTSKNDDSIGSKVDGSTGNPLNDRFAAPALNIEGAASLELSNVRIAYAQRGLEFVNQGADIQNVLSHAQIVSTHMPCYSLGNTLNLRNVLVHNADYVAAGEGFNLQIEHLTAHAVQNLVLDFAGSGELSLKNSLLVAVPSIAMPYVSESTYWYYNEVPAFQSVRAGAHYLTDAYRFLGTLNIDSTLRDALRKKTTHAPTLLTGSITSQTLGRTVPRDDGASVTCGYHYDAVDWLVSGIIIGASAIVEIGTGAAVAIDFTSGQRGFSFGSGAQLTGTGAPLTPNWIVWNHAVQESLCASPESWAATFSAGSPSAIGTFRFTRFPMMGGDYNHLDNSGEDATFNFTDCQLLGGLLDSFGGHSFAFKNCLLETVQLRFNAENYPISASFYNCLFRGGKFELYDYYFNSGTAYSIYDNLFDSVETYGDPAPVSGHNAFYASQPFDLNNGNRTISQLSYSSGPLGHYYLGPTHLELINGGSRSAIDAGLFNYTLDGSTRDTGYVDIGMHYPFVAAPTVSAGADQRILLGQTASLLGEITSGSKGKIVICHDEWIMHDWCFFENSKVTRATHSFNFAVNVAHWFEPQGNGRFLGCNSAVGSYAVAAFDVHGHTWDYDPSPSVDLEKFLGYDAVFLAEDFSSPTGGPAVRGQTFGPILTDYVNSGGNVFILGGTPLSEPLASQLWNPFLNQFGLGFAATGNPIGDTYTDVNSTHPLLWNVQRLYHDVGNSVFRSSATDPNTEMLLQLGTDDLLATFAEKDSSTPPVWSKVSGPGTVTFSPPNSASTSATFSQGGTYVLRLSSSYAGLIGQDDVTVYVNAAPTVTASGPSTIDIIEVASLSGTVNNADNLPAGIVPVVDWSVVDAPPSGSVKLLQDPANPTDRTYAKATFSKPGTYRLRLSASDSLLSGHAELVIEVTKVNSAPVVNAGPDQTIEFAERAYLPGTATDDGLPGPLTITWTKQSGPGTVVFDDSHAPTTFAGFSEPGTYILQLAADDDELDQVPAVFDQVSINIGDPHIHTFRGVDYVSAGVSGLRNYGEGTITLAGVSGTVRKAYLYWHGPTAVSDPQANAGLLVNGRFVAGTNTGTSFNNGWGFPKYSSSDDSATHSYNNSMAYRADITRLLSEFGNGVYTISRLYKPQEVNVNGASIVVLFNDTDPANDRDIILADRHDSNGGFDYALGQNGEAKFVASDGTSVLISGGWLGTTDLLQRALRATSKGKRDPLYVGDYIDAEVSRIVPHGGGLFIAGAFQHIGINAVPRNGIAKLNANGTLATAFDPGTGPNGSIYALCVDGGGKVIVAGSFTEFNGSPRSRIARLNADGTVDSTFNPLTVNGTIWSMRMDSMARILIGGEFSFTFPGMIVRYGIARLNSDGSLDTTFVPPGTDVGHARAIQIQGDEKTIFWDLTSAKLIRLNANGTRDTSFDPPALTGPIEAGNDLVSSIAIHENSGIRRIYVAGSFTAPRPHLIALTDLGAEDTAFSLQTTGFALDPYSSGKLKVNSIAVDADGKLIVGGKFNAYGDLPRDHLARLHSNGSLDTSFQCSDREWEVLFPQANYTGGSIELHVSDGQHYIHHDFNPAEFADAALYVNGVFWLGHTLMNVCEAPRANNQQIFQGESPLAPSANHFPCTGNLNLWEIREAMLPAGIGTRTLRITTDPLGYALGSANEERTLFGDDAISLVLVAAKLTAGSLPALSNPPVSPLADSLPIARADQFSIPKHLGAKILNVLENDSGILPGLLKIISVSAPAHRGAGVEIAYNGSALIYSPDSAFSGSNPDEFTYTVMDSNGNTGTATVTIALQNSPTVEQLACDSTAIAGLLSSTDALSTTRAGGEFADYYWFSAAQGYTVTITVTPAASTFEAHCYVRDPHGWLIASSHHTSSSLSASVTVPILASGRYTVEVTSHSVGQIGSYSIAAACQAALNDLEVIANGVLVSENGLIEIGSSAKTILVWNRGTANIEGDMPLAVLGSSEFTVSPSVLAPMPANSIRAVLVTPNTSTLGFKTALLKIGPSATLPAAGPRTNRLQALIGPPPPPVNADSPVANDDSAVLFVNASATPIPVLANDTDPNGDSLRIQAFTQGHFGSVAVDAAGQTLTYAPAANSYGTDVFTYTIADSKGRTDTAVVKVEVVEPIVRITAPANNTLVTVGSPVTVSVQASNSRTNITRIELYTNGVKYAEQPSSIQESYTFEFTPPAQGFYSLKAAALHSDGTRSDSSAITIAAGISGDLPPTAFIANLQDGQFLREAQFELRGTADDADTSPVTHTIDLYRPTSDGLAHVKNIVSNGGRVQGIGSLGVMDLTSLENGVYVLVLRVGSGVLSRTADVRFILHNQAKIGQFTFSEQDLSIPVNGIPISIVRTFDSQNLSAGDFSTGWSLAVNDVRFEIDEERELTPIDPDQPGAESLLMRTGGGRNVTLTLPDGRRATFAFTLVPGPKDGDVPCFCYEAKWIAPPGVYATLVPMGNNRLQFIPWQTAIPPFWAEAGPETPFDNFDFSGFWLTNVDGTVYEIHRDRLGDVDLPTQGAILPVASVYGPGKLRKITTTTGDRIVIGTLTGSPGGQEFRIDNLAAGLETASSSVVCTRNSDRRITALYDPIGLSTTPRGAAVVLYEYYGAADPKGAPGNLKCVRRLKNRVANPQTTDYETTTYEYTISGHPSFVSAIINPRGDKTVIKYEAGRFTGTDLEFGGSLVSVQHDLANRKEIITDSAGNKTVHEYDLRGNVVRTVDASGAAINRSYDNAGNVVAETDPLGNATTYGYDAKGNRSAETNALGGITQWTSYNRFGQARTILDPRQKSTTYDYDDSDSTPTGNLKSMTDAALAKTDYAYDSRNRLLTVSDPLGHITEYEYYDTSGPDGRIGDLKSVSTKERLPGEPPQYRRISHTTYIYDANGNRRTEKVWRNPEPSTPTDPLTAEYIYDGQNRVIETRNALYDAATPTENRVVVTYNALGKVEARRDALNRETKYLYDRRGNLIQTVFLSETGMPLVLSRTVYDANDRPEYVQERVNVPTGGEFADTLARGSRTVYDALGRVVATERLDSFRVSISLVDGGYVAQAHSTTTSFSVLSSTATRYDEAGRVAQSIDARGGSTFYSYDAAGRRVAVTDALGHVSSFEYDKNGNQTAFIDALNRRTTYDYDALNRGTHVRYVQGNPDETAYDALGRRTKQVDQEGKVTLFGYDGLGRLTSVTNAFDTPDQAITRYKYDGAGNLIEQLDANQSIKPVAEQKPVRFEYDKLNRRTKRQLPEGQFELFAYDAVGNMSSHTNFAYNAGSTINPHITDFKYDALNRLKKKFERSLGENSPWATVTYNALGQRLTMKSYMYGAQPWSYEVSFEYDDLNRLQSKIIVDEGTIGYVHDLAGNLTRITAYNTIDYEYDGLNRLTKVLRDAAHTASYRYDAVGNLKEVTLANNVASVYTYDALNRLTLLNVEHRPTSTLAADFNYATAGLSGTGKRLGVNETVGGITRVVRYTYDNRYRLIREQLGTSGSEPAVGYLYDKVGNREQRTSTVTGVPEHPDYNYNGNDWLTDYGTESQPTSFDENGNTLLGEVTPAQTANDEYDYENRLIKRTVSGRTIELRYDAEGNRVAKIITEGGVVKTTRYLVDELNPTGYPQVLYQSTTLPDGNVPPGEAGWERRYVYGLDLISTHIDSTDTRYYGYDGHGSVRFLTDSAGTITDTYTYDAFGIQLSSTDTTPNNYRFAGEYYDSDLGQYYNTARIYNPQTGRFWTMDTHEGSPDDPLSLHKYLYCHADPVNRIDPSGHSSSLAGQLTVIGIALNIAFLANDSVSLGRNLASGNRPGAAFDSVAVAVDLALLGIPFSGPGAAAARSSGGVIQMAVAAARSGSTSARLAWAAIRSAIMSEQAAGDSSEGGGSSGSSSGAGGTGEPGSWQSVPESMPARARAYQAAISGRAASEVYVVNGTKFDGYRGGTLIEAKGPGYASFFKFGQPRYWFHDGAEALVGQAERQLQAARGIPIEWHVAEREAADAIRALLQRDPRTAAVNVIHTPAR